MPSSSWGSARLLDRHVPSNAGARPNCGGPFGVRRREHASGVPTEGASGGRVRRMPMAMPISRLAPSASRRSSASSVAATRSTRLWARRARLSVRSERLSVRSARLWVRSAALCADSSRVRTSSPLTLASLTTGRAQAHPTLPGPRRPPRSRTGPSSGSQGRTGVARGGRVPGRDGPWERGAQIGTSTLWVRPSALLGSADGRDPAVGQRPPGCLFIQPSPARVGSGGRPAGRRGARRSTGRADRPLHRRPAAWTTGHDSCGSRPRVPR